MVISGWILLRMRNISDKSCKEDKNAHILYLIIFLFWKSCSLSGSVEKIRYSQTGRMGSHAPCMLRNWGYRHTHSEYVILIAFTRQQWLCECASMLRDITLSVFFFISAYCIYLMWKFCLFSKHYPVSWMFLNKHLCWMREKSVDFWGNLLNIERQVTFATPCIYFLDYPWLAKLSQKLRLSPF